MTALGKELADAGAVDHVADGVGSTAATSAAVAAGKTDAGKPGVAATAVAAGPLAAAASRATGGLDDPAAAAPVAAAPTTVAAATTAGASARVRRAARQRDQGAVEASRGRCGRRTVRGLSWPARKLIQASGQARKARTEPDCGSRGHRHGDQGRSSQAARKNSSAPLRK